MNSRGLLKRLLALPAALLWWRKPKGVPSIRVESEWGRLRPNYTNELQKTGVEIYDWSAVQRGFLKRNKQFFDEWMLDGVRPKGKA